MRRNTDLGIDAYRIGSLLHKHADRFVVQPFSVLGKENILLFEPFPDEEPFSCTQILVKELADRWILGNDAFLPSLTVNYEVGILYLVQLHVDQFAQPDPCIKKDHEDHFVAYTDIVVAVVILDHPLDLFAVEGMDQDLRLLHILDPLGQDLFTVPFPLRISAQALDRFEQIVDIRGLTSPVLQGTDVLFYMDRFQLLELDHLIVFPCKMSEFVELSLIILDGRLRQIP